MSRNRLTRQQLLGLLLTAILGLLAVLAVALLPRGQVSPDVFYSPDSISAKTTKVKPKKKKEAKKTATPPQRNPLDEPI